MKKFFINRYVFSIAATCFAMSAYGNMAQLTNASPDGNSITLVYEIAHKNADGNTVLGAPQTIELKSSTAVAFELDGFDLAGIVPISVNGRFLPSDANQFDQPQQCSLTTDKSNRLGELSFISTDKSISCSVHGGIF